MTHDRDADGRQGLDPLKYLPIAAYVDEVDGDGGVYTSYGSQKYEELTGVAPGALYEDATSWDDRVHRDDYEEYARSFDALWKERREQDVVYRFRRGDDEWVWLRDRASARYDAARGVTVISGVIADVTRERAAEEEAARTRAALESAVEERTGELARSLEELRASRANLARAQQLACAGSFEWTAGVDATASDELLRIYGIDPGTRFDRAAALAAVHADDRDRFAAAVAAAAVSGGEASAEFRIVRPDGEVRFVEAHVHVEHGPGGAPHRVIGSVQDVTARHEAEQAVRRSRDLLRVIAEVSARFISMPLAAVDEAVLDTLARVGSFVGADRCYVVLLDEAGDTVTNTHEWCSPGIESTSSFVQGAPVQAFAWTVGKLLADEPVAVERLCDLPEDAEPERALIAAQGVRSLLMVPLRGAVAPLGLVGFDAVHREVAWPQETVLLLRAVADALAGAFERRRAEEELRRLNATLGQHVGERTRELTAANRELEGFVQSVAHDLRGPLRTIGSFGQILLFEHADELSPDGRDALRRILRANARLARLIDGLLELSGLTQHTLRLQPVDVTRMAHHVVDDLRELQPGHAVEVVIAEGLRAEADPVLTAIVLENLLGNAWKFTGAREQAHIEVSVEERAGETVFCVRDDGVGFDQQYAHRLFEAFERLHDDTAYGGTGIGLATVRRIVGRHGGRVWAEGRPGEGAAFFFTLAPPAG